MTTITATAPAPAPVQPTAEHRTEMIAGLRALAQLLEDRPDIPCPHSGRVQHSVLDPYDTALRCLAIPDAERIAYVKGVADRLGVTATITDTSVGFDYSTGGRTFYVVHANLNGDRTAGDPDCLDPWHRQPNEPDGRCPACGSEPNA